MHYVADSLHYQPQGMYLAAKWGEARRDAAIPDPLEVVESLGEKYGIEVTG